MDFALCHLAGGEPDLFFPAPGEVDKIEQAKRICEQCPVRQECRAYHEGNGDRYGVWAGEYFNGGRTKIA